MKEGSWAARNKFGFKADFFIFARKNAFPGSQAPKFPGT
jgi:hypothetical protein